MSVSTQQAHLHGISLYTVDKVAIIHSYAGVQAVRSVLEGVTKMYDVTPVTSKWDMFKVLNDQPEIFGTVEVDADDYGIIWGGGLDISCDEL